MRVKGEVKANTIYDVTFDGRQKCSKSNFSSRARWFASERNYFCLKLHP